MDDRLTPALYLEFADSSPAEYAVERIPALLARGGIERATWWEDCVPGRRDLPRTLPDARTLGLYEIGAAFEPPIDTDRGIHMVRTSRPGQGRLTGRPTVGLELVLISPREDVSAQALRDWADFVHLRHIAEATCDGFTMITPYEHAAGGRPRFMHLYEMDTDAPEAAFQAMTPTVAARIGAPGTPTFDAWAWHPALWIEYVSTFRLIGERSS